MLSDVAVLTNGLPLNGYCEPAFAQVGRALDKIIKKAPYGGGAAISVYHRGKLVVDLWGGSRDETGAPWLQDTMAISFSTSKGIVSTLLHILVDKGVLSYDKPVAYYWPEFAANGKENITVRQVLSHEAGLYQIESLIDRVEDIYDWDLMTTLLAQASPVHTPGGSHGYHGLTYGWLAGEIIQRATKRSLRDLLNEEIVKPLNLDGVYIGLPAEQMHRSAQLIVADMLKKGLPKPLQYLYTVENSVIRLLSLNRFNLDRLKEALLLHRFPEFDATDPRFLQACVPAANGVFTARSLARIYGCLANGGTLDGVHLISPEALTAATRQQNWGLDKVVLLPMGWRLGYHRVFCPGFNLAQAFGHFGFGGSGAWADPVRNIAVGVTVNNGVGTPFGDVRIVELSRAVLKCVERGL